jgi:hypothetical protein
MGTYVKFFDLGYFLSYYPGKITILAQLSSLTISHWRGL